MRIIAFISQKGGCGKTTSCVNLSVALAEAGRRVLIVDLDSNACSSRTLDVISTLDNSVGAVLLGDGSLASVIRATAIDRVWLVPGSTDLSVVEQVKQNQRGDGAMEGRRIGEITLARELDQLDSGQFDYVFLDCPGGYPLMQRMALLASSEVIIPTGLSVYDLYAATPTLQLILAARRARGKDLPLFLGFLPNGAGKAGVPKKMQGVLDTYSAPCFSPVRQSALLKSIAGAPKVEQRVILLARPEHAASASYRQVAREIEMGLEAARTVTQARREESDLSSGLTIEEAVGAT